MTTENAIALDLEIARKCMLLERVGPIFDLIPMSDPMQRVILIAKGLSAASKENENLRKLIQQSGYIDTLKAHARYRETGEMKLPSALKSVFEAPASAARRETSRV